MASSSAHRLFLLAFLAFLAAAAPRAAAWGGGRLFFSKTTRPDAAVQPEKAATTATPEAAESNTVPAFSRPSGGGGGGRGYGLYGRPEENYPPAYFRRGVHRNAEKLTTAAAAADVPTTTDTTTEEEAAVPARGGDERAEPLGAEDNGSGRGRPPYYYGYTALRGAGWEPEQRRDYYGMSDTRLYQNGRYYYDVDTGKYGYGYESNPVRTRPDELGSGYGRPRAGAGDRRGMYGNAAAYEYRNGNEFGNAAAAENPNGGFQENRNDEQYIP
ncbi:hypothetical protein ACP70R_038350 [Stipagrostis hirtigluma subsp. patula]